MNEAPADDSTYARRAAGISTTDYPPQLGEWLAKLESLWRATQNTVCVARAVQLCNSWTDAEGNSTGPYKPPLWCLPVLGKFADGIMGSARLDPPPRGRRLQRRVTHTLGLSSQGRSPLKNWQNDTSCMLEAALFDIYRAEGRSPVWIYRTLCEKGGKKSSNLRTVQIRLAKGRRLLKLMSNASMRADNPVERRMAALADAVTVCRGDRVTLFVLRPHDPREIARIYTNTSALELQCMLDEVLFDFFRAERAHARPSFADRLAMADRLAEQSKSLPAKKPLP
jgi:hypothetical protein